jgi:transposase, IS5 family
VIRKGKASKTTEFVFRQRPSHSDLLTPSIKTHKGLLDRIPDLVAADAGFFSGANDTAAKDLGLKRVAVRSRFTKSAKRKEEQKEALVPERPKVAHLASKL